METHLDKNCDVEGKICIMYAKAPDYIVIRNDRKKNLESIYIVP